VDGVCKETSTGFCLWCLCGLGRGEAVCVEARGKDGTWVAPFLPCGEGFWCSG